ncbi:MAG TPA: 50S ribosomal protein L9 [Bacillota bacterium]|nr:50S ribosomal protein L9 [Candidatus Fermentithermobacillaceae bacterium]HOB30741.1 50S ribosomal protein L9 [Bacillota bacterium]HOK64862.1 50S ribosomal protein L9 [Bacillota bacterium]HOL12595.1 50S ribosomal protein L9 [Bacillota bacterium]HOQ03317.1 50S ribosomal protein L9 [Bacillota bacterium]
MDVILKQDVAGLGVRGDVVTVKDGYARNYLIPKGLAVPATKSAVREHKHMAEAQAKKEDRLLGEARRSADKIDGKTIVFRAKAGPDRIFGSVTALDIAEKIKSTFGVSVDKRKVLLSENLKELGQHKVEIQLYPGVKAEVIVDIQPEGGE